MNINNRKILYLFLFFVLFTSVTPLFCAVNVVLAERFDPTRILGFDPQELRSSALRTSGYHNLSGSSIVIDDADPNYNWSKTAAENPWCSGSGTFNDPYVIENVYIDGDMSIVETVGKQHSANCLSIYRSTAYFIVRGCYFTKSGTDEFNSGIYLAYVENGIIYNNSLSFHHQAVFVNDFSSNITVFYNVIEHNHELYGPNRAMMIQFSDDTLVVKNLVVNCKVGIQLHESVRTEIRQNLLNSSLYGVPVSLGMHFRQVNDSKITYNVFAGDYSGTTFEVLQEDSSGNVVQNNTISGVIPSDLGTPAPPKTSGDYTDLIKLTECNFNEVKHNIAYVAGYVAPAEIPGFDVFIILGSIGLVSTLLLARTAARKRNKN